MNVGTCSGGERSFGGKFGSCLYKCLNMFIEKDYTFPLALSVSARFLRSINLEDSVVLTAV